MQSYGVRKSKSNVVGVYFMVVPRAYMHKIRLPVSNKAVPVNHYENDHVPPKDGWILALRSWSQIARFSVTEFTRSKEGRPQARQSFARYWLFSLGGGGGGNDQLKWSGWFKPLALRSSSVITCSNICCMQQPVMLQKSREIIRTIKRVGCPLGNTCSSAKAVDIATKVSCCHAL